MVYRKYTFTDHSLRYITTKLSFTMVLYEVKSTIEIRI